MSHDIARSQQTAVEEVIAYLEARLPKLTPPDSAEEWLARAERSRRELLALLLEGHPEELLEAVPAVEWQEVLEPSPEYRIHKLCYEGYPGLWVPALLYEPTALSGMAPVVLNAEGHHTAGNALAMKQERCINLARRGILALSYEFVGMGQLVGGNAHHRLAQLSACGRCGVGIFYLVMKRALDILLAHPGADSGRVAMTGCSGGGWQTMLLSALDTRITQAIPVAGHSAIWQRIHHLSDLGDNEQLPSDICTIADYDVLTAMLAPRPSLLIFNHYDTCCFATERAVPATYDRARPVYELLGAAEALGLHDSLYPRSHNYDQPNREQAYAFLEARFQLPSRPEEIPCGDEIMTPQEAAVRLPDDNQTLLTLARQALTTARGVRRQYRQESNEKRRQQLRELLHLPELSVDAVEEDGRLLRLGAWTVPVGRSGSKSATAETLIVLHDRGISSTQGRRWRKQVAAGGQRVLSVDIFGTGSRRVPTQYYLAFDSSGERGLGLQVAQVLALLRHAGGRCAIAAGGLTTPLVALMAAAVEPELVASLTTDMIMPTLDQLVEWPIDYADCPTLFCRNLLAYVDVDDLIALSAPVPIADGARPLLRKRT